MQTLIQKNKLTLVQATVNIKDRQNNKILECGPMPNVMADLRNIGGTLCSTPQILADTHYYSALQ